MAEKYAFIVCLCVCVPILRLLIINGMTKTTSNWLDKFCSFYATLIVGVVSRRGLRIEAFVEISLICESRPSTVQAVIFTLKPFKICTVVRPEPIMLVRKNNRLQIWQE